MVNVIHLRPRKPPPFPLDSEGERLANTAEQMHLDEQSGVARIEDSPPIPTWEIKTITPNNTAQTDDLSETLMACAMGMGGQIIVAVGAKGSIWIWNERSESAI
jgi:polycomb protein EED